MEDEKLSPMAKEILEGLNEVLKYVSGEPVEGVRVSVVYRDKGRVVAEAEEDGYGRFGESAEQVGGQDR